MHEVRDISLFTRRVNHTRRAHPPQGVGIRGTEHVGNADDVWCAQLAGMPLTLADYTIARDGTIYRLSPSGQCAAYDAPAYLQGAGGPIWFKGYRLVWIAVECCARRHLSVTEAQHSAIVALTLDAAATHNFDVWRIHTRLPTHDEGRATVALPGLSWPRIWDLYRAPAWEHALVGTTDVLKG